MNKPLAISIGLGLLVVFVLFSTTFSVSFHEVAVKKRFGQQEAVIAEPGLQFKLPIFADQVSKYDARLQILEPPAQTILTADGQQVVVHGYLLWRIDVEDEANVRKFDEQHGSLDGASNYITDSFGTALLAGLGQYEFDELIGPDSRLQEAEAAILERLASLKETGIKPESIGISKVQFPQRTSRAVLKRMEATRQSLARSERSKGNAEAQRIQSEANTMADRINAFAMQRAAEIRAAGDEEAARYIAQMGEEEELAIFLVWLDAMEAALSERTTMILETGYAPMHFLNFRSPLSAQGVPQPANTYAQRRDQEAIRAALADNLHQSAIKTLADVQADDDAESSEEPTDSSAAEKGN